MRTAPGTHYQHFYISGTDGHPVPKITVCYIRTEHDTSVGIAICSLIDNHNKARGRRLAHGRALAAQAGKISPLLREEALRVLYLASLREQTENKRSIKNMRTKALKVNDPGFLIVEDFTSNARP
jgi:hypothetical protein